MGLTRLQIEVANPSDIDRAESIELLVDSGATSSVVPAAMLARLGIAPIREQTFRLANGDNISRRVGTAAFKYGGRVGGAGVLFAEEDDANLLGAFTLEALGLSLDPIKRELLELPMLL